MENTAMQLVNIMKSDPKHAFIFAYHNIHKLSESELSRICRELFYAIHDMDEKTEAEILGSAAYEIEAWFDNDGSVFE